MPIALLGEGIVKSATLLQLTISTATTSHCLFEALVWNHHLIDELNFLSMFLSTEKHAIGA
jgi:hypothetical protein